MKSLEESFCSGGLKHSHDNGAGVVEHEKRARSVVVLTLAMMVAELVVGYATNSLSLTADGWHMATHAGALGLTAFAYWFARSKATSSEFSFGTGKVHALAGYTSAVVLSIVALLMLGESLKRLYRPETIAFEQALPVAVLGLVVNLACAKLLHTDHGVAVDHDDDEIHHHGQHGADDAHRRHRDRGHDHNLRAAYFHVLADALTSVMAILALLGGHYFRWGFLDAFMGIVGGVIIARWGWGLCLSAAKQLVDVVPSADDVARIRARIEATSAGAQVVDLHLWDIGPSARACIVSVVTPSPESPAVYHEALSTIACLKHITVEVNTTLLGSHSPLADPGE